MSYAEMVEIAGLDDGDGLPPPPPPQGQIRANRLRKDWRFKLPADAWQEGPGGLMSLGDMLQTAA
eukprot:12408871-Karenia_brevis.AAC.1